MVAKGAAIKFKSYSETVPKILELLNLHYELKKYDRVILKPNLSKSKENSTPIMFVEAVLRFCLAHKNPVTEILIAEGSDGVETSVMFDEMGYSKLAERYGISLVDLNEAESEEIENAHFKKFSVIKYPTILKNSFVISLPKASEDEETVISGALSNMLGTFPSKHYSGFFATTKNKIRKWPIKFSIHDILVCKMPDFAVVDSSEKGIILAGLPFEMDKQIAKILGIDWQRVSYLNILHEQFGEEVLALNKLH